MANNRIHSFSDVATSAHLSQKEYLKAIETLRSQFTDFKIVDEKIVLATPVDASNKTGALSATHVTVALQDGKPVAVTCVAVVRIKWVHEEGHHHGGHREIVTDATIVSVSA